MTKYLLSAAAIITIAFAPAAHASENFERGTIVVAHADLDLATTTDERRLQTRVRTAIAALCRTDRSGLKAVSRANECRTQAQSKAARQIGHAVAQARKNGTRLAGDAAKPAA